MLMKADQSFLLLIDLQERLVPAVARNQAVVANTSLLVKAARRLGVPVLATEHYPRGIGHSVAELRGLLEPGEVLTKIHFSAQAEQDCARRFAALKRPTVVVAGTEAHVCVLQTCLDLKASGYRPCVVANAVSSRNAIDRDLALQRLQAAGLPIVTVEMVLFEWLARGDTTEFRELLPLIKGISAF